MDAYTQWLDKALKRYADPDYFPSAEIRQYDSRVRMRTVDDEKKFCRVLCRRLKAFSGHCFCELFAGACNRIVQVRVPRRQSSPITIQFCFADGTIPWATFGITLNNNVIWQRLAEMRAMPLMLLAAPRKHPLYERMIWRTVSQYLVHKS